MVWASEAKAVNGTLGDGMHFETVLDELTTPKMSDRTRRMLRANVLMYAKLIEIDPKTV